MGCFCRNLIPAPLPTDVTDAEQDRDAPATEPLAQAVASWLSSRWLPAPPWLPASPWVPDPAWLDVDLPEPPVPPAALSVLSSLFVAEQACQTSLGLDLEDPRQAAQLPRIVATLNARQDQLQELEQDRRPWLALMELNAQTDMIQAAIRQDLFTAPRQDDRTDVRRAPWKPLLLRVKALAPLVAIGSMAKLDWRQPDAMTSLANKVKLLARIKLPPLADAALVLRQIARLDAVARLKDSLGADPSGHPYSRVRLAVERRAQQALASLPPGIRLEEGELVGMPDLPPNPASLLNPQTIRAASQLTPQTVARLNWQVPAYDQLPLLTAGLPVAQLAKAMAQLGPDPVRQSPCGSTCDAAKVMRAAAA